MKDILLLYDGEDAEKWKDYIYDMLCENDLNLSVVCKNLRTEEAEILKICSDFLVVSTLVSPVMLETMSSAPREVAAMLQDHACVTVILLYTELADLRTELEPKFRTVTNWASFDITEKPDTENKKTVSKIIDMLEKEKHRKKKPPDSAAKSKHPSDKPKKVKRGTRSARSILESVCPERVSKKGEVVMMVLKQPMEGVIQVEFKDKTSKIDTKKLNPYCYSFIAPDLIFGRHQFYIFVDGELKSAWPLPYVSPTQKAYECPAFLCQALDIPPDDMDILDRKLTAIFRASLPNDEALTRILTPGVLTSLTAATKVDHHFPTLLHFAAFHGLRDLCNALLDMPGAVAAFHKKNIDDKDPIDLAEEREHEDLVDFFLAYIEMQETLSTYEQFYVHMYDKQGGVKPGYIDMGPGSGYLPMVPGPDHVQDVDYDKDDYEIKSSTIASGVTEVLEEEDIQEEPKPGRPPRKPKKPVPTRPPAQKSREASPPPPTPRRKPLHDELLEEVEKLPPAPPLPEQTPEDLFNMPHEGQLHNTGSLGSASLGELVEIQEAFKRREINEKDVEMLYSSWTKRSKEGRASDSMKERQRELNAMREKYQTLIQTAGKKEKRGFFGRMTKKKKKPEIEIEHVTTSNPYTSWSSVPSGFTPAVPMSERDTRLSTISNSSTSSSSSYASSSSRDSALSLSRIPESDSEGDEKEPPEVPTRPTHRTSSKNRKSMSEQFLLAVQNKPSSRLPTPPAQYKPPAHPKVSAHKAASVPFSSPARPPRKTSN